MSYTDLSTMKKINGLPADLRFFEELNENDAFLKSAIDTDEDLSALDRDITPVTDNLYNLGLSNKRFSHAYVNQVITNLLTLPSGTILNPAVTFGTAGLASLNANQLSVIAGGLEPVKFMTSGMLVKAANSTQFKIENTLPGSLGQWTLGVDNTGFSLLNTSGLSVLNLKVTDAALEVQNKLSVPSGTEVSPSIAFATDLSTGISKDSSLAKLNFSISGVSQLALDEEGLSLSSGKLNIPVGTSTEPSLYFNGYSDMGFSALAFNSLGILVGGKVVHKFGNGGRDIQTEGVSFDVKRVYSAPGLPAWNTDLSARANGQIGLETEILANEELYMNAVEGYTDAGWQRVSEITVKSLEDYDSGSYGASLTLATIPLGGEELQESLYINEATVPSVHIPFSLGLGKAEINSGGTAQNIDVSNISKLLIDATSGNIGINGFIGGKEGQMLYIYKKVPNNTFTLIFNSGTATQKVLLKGSANFVNTNDYGGITLSFDDGIWREVSRS